MNGKRSGDFLRKLAFTINPSLNRRTICCVSSHWSVSLWLTGLLFCYTSTAVFYPDISSDLWTLCSSLLVFYFTWQHLNAHLWISLFITLYTDVEYYLYILKSKSYGCLHKNFTATIQINLCKTISITIT